MKSLILKDLYNISHNTKTMLFMLLAFAFIFVPTSGSESYMVVSCLLCSMMVITTFSFDERSKWERYAMIMPVSKKDVVAGKFVVLFIFSIVGVTWGFVVSLIGGVLANRIVLDKEGIVMLLVVALIAFEVAMILGSLSIPLIFKFGAENARMMSMLAILVPGVIVFLIYRLLLLLGISVTDQVMNTLMMLSPIAVLIWNYVMYKISYIIFMKKEL